MAELFVANTLTGLVPQTSHAKAEISGTEGVSELGRVGNCAEAKIHMHRDVMGRLTKCCTLIDPYWCLAHFSTKRMQKRNYMHVHYCYLIKFWHGSCAGMPPE